MRLTRTSRPCFYDWKHKSHALSYWLSQPADKRSVGAEADLQALWCRSNEVGGPRGQTCVWAFPAIQSATFGLSTIQHTVLPQMEERTRLMTGRPTCGQQVQDPLALMTKVR